MPDFSHFQEANEVTKTFEVVTNKDFDGSGGPSTVRVEILRCLDSGRYKVRWSQLTSFYLQPSYPVKNGQYKKVAGDYEVWVPLDLPWVDEKDEDRAIERAIGWLNERDA